MITTLTAIQYRTNHDKNNNNLTTMYSVIYICSWICHSHPLGIKQQEDPEDWGNQPVMRSTGPTPVRHQDPPVARGSRHIRLLRAPTVGCQITDSSQGQTRGGHRLHPITVQEFQSSECSKPVACI